MRELNNIKIIAVDHGYGNIKTANTVTPTGVAAYETEPIFSGNILEYGDLYYRVGEGHKEFIADKAIDEDYYILTLMAVARELNIYGIREADVHLAAGLPLTWIRKQREEFRSYLLRNKEVDFRFNNKANSFWPGVVGMVCDFSSDRVLILTNDKKSDNNSCKLFTYFVT